MQNESYKLRLSPMDQSADFTQLGRIYLTDFIGIEEDSESIQVHYADEQKLQAALSQLALDDAKWDIQTETIAAQNWNAVWESGYEKVKVGDQIEVRAPFHTPGTAEYEMVIDPQMSFGTGHHPTTYLMLEAMLKMDFRDRDVLDLGAGSGVLSILAAMCGARHIDAVEIEPIAAENIAHNAALNEVNVNIVSGVLDDLSPLPYDYILANINKNIILAEKDNIQKRSKPRTTLLLSGFYERDIASISSAFESLNFYKKYHKIEQDWAIIVLDYGNKS